MIIITKPGEVVWEGGYNVPYIWKMNCRSRIKNKSDCNCSSVHSKVIKMESIKWNLMHDDLAFSQFLWNLKSIFSCSHENLFFEVISYKLITLKALEKCQSECDTRV